MFLNALESTKVVLKYSKNVYRDQKKSKKCSKTNFRKFYQTSWTILDISTFDNIRNGNFTIEGHILPVNSGNLSKCSCTSNSASKEVGNGKIEKLKNLKRGLEQ